MQNINSKEYWDFVYTREGKENNWRISPQSFDRVTEIIGGNKVVFDLGGGCGILAKQLLRLQNKVIVFDISEVAVDSCINQGIEAYCCKLPPIPNQDVVPDWIVGCEFLEHFHYPEKMIKNIAENSNQAILEVPDNCLNNMECKEHYSVFTEETFKQLLEKYYSDVKIEKIIDQYSKNDVHIYLNSLMAICKNSKIFKGSLVLDTMTNEGS